jgi:chemotaxis protein methyltransferase CheR
VAEPLRKKYFTHVGTEYQISDRLREGVEFQRHDLLNDRYPANMHLILCRNVVIYFSDDAKQRVFNGFYQTLRPGGYLLLGSTERIADAPLIGYTSPRPFFYHRKR